MKIIINKNQSNIKLDKFLLDKYQKFNRKDLYNFFRKKEIRVNNFKIDSNYVLEDGDEITFSEFVRKIMESPINIKEVRESEHLDFDKVSPIAIENFKNTIIFENDNLFAINKKHGLATQGGTGITTCVDSIIKNINFLEGTNYKLVHRLDRDTTGVLMIAKNLETVNKLFEYFKTKRAIEKYYLTVVSGEMKDKGTINFKLLKKYENNIEKVYKDDVNGKEAITEYETVFYSEQFDVSVVLVRILTGRTHQIRVHMKEIGHPVLGDFKYFTGNTNRDLSKDLQLHSFRTNLKLFDDEIYLKAPLPDHMARLFKKIKFHFYNCSI